MTADVKQVWILIKQSSIDIYNILHVLIYMHASG